MKARKIIAGAVGLLLVGCGGEELPQGEMVFPHMSRKTSAIKGGETDEVHTAVVGIAIQSGNAFGGCTGSLVAPNMVITAQHCVADSPEGGIVCGQHAFEDPHHRSAFLVTTRTSLPFTPSGYYDVDEVLVPSNNADICGEDIAVLILRDNIPFEEAVPIVPRVDVPVEHGEIFDAVGYGHIGDGSGAGTRRIIRGREVLCGGNECVQGGAPVTRTEFVGNDGTCEGDSGGPALDSRGRVLGALSRGGDGCSFPVYSAVYNWGDWLRQIGLVASERGGYAPHAWVTSGLTDVLDFDNDGVEDDVDNCPYVANADQSDVDDDGIGDDCDDTDDRPMEPDAEVPDETPDAGPVGGGEGGAGGAGEGSADGGIIRQDGDGSGDGGGGSCASVASAPGAGGWWALMAALALGMRRRRR